MILDIIHGIKDTSSLYSACSVQQKRVARCVALCPVCSPTYECWLALLAGSSPPCLVLWQTLATPVGLLPALTSSEFSPRYTMVSLLLGAFAFTLLYLNIYFVLSHSLS